MIIYHLVKENGNYSGELESYVIIQVLNFNILLLKYTEDDDSINYYEYYNFYGFYKETKYLPLSIMNYIEENKHYELLYYYKEYNISNMLLNRDQIKSDNHPNEIKNICFNNNEKNINENKINNSGVKDVIKSFNKNEISIVTYNFKILSKNNHNTNNINRFEMDANKLSEKKYFKLYYRKC